MSSPSAQDQTGNFFTATTGLIKNHVYIMASIRTGFLFPSPATFLREHAVAPYDSWPTDQRPDITGDHADRLLHWDIYCHGAGNQGTIYRIIHGNPSLSRGQQWNVDIVKLSGVQSLASLIGLFHVVDLGAWNSSKAILEDFVREIGVWRQNLDARDWSFNLLDKFVVHLQQRATPGLRTTHAERLDVVRIHHEAREWAVSQLSFVVTAIGARSCPVLDQAVPLLPPLPPCQPPST